MKVAVLHRDGAEHVNGCDHKLQDMFMFTKVEQKEIISIYQAKGVLIFFL